MGRILVVDDELHMQRILQSTLAQANHVITAVGGVEEARRQIACEQFDAILTDYKLADGSGVDVLTAAHEADPTVSVVFLTALASLELAVESMRQGAYYFLAKPFTAEVVRATALRACKNTALLRENRALKEVVVRLEGSSEIFGDSSAMQRVRECIARVAPTHATVLITGETGTGKELVARAIHKHSPRADRPFIPVNCAAFTETLLESELFGHERGAFTGADRARAGLFEAAHEGTLFLDEIGEMSQAAQAKLLRVLTDGKIVRLGSTAPRQVNVRVLAATHRDLKQRIQEGVFREDLFYRLAVVPIPIPPLRERREDIPGLCELFLAQIAADLKQEPHRLSAKALQMLQQYDFPGNIRELRNLVERACILSAGTEITSDALLSSSNGAGQGHASTLEEWVSTLPESFEIRDLLAEIERTCIERALQSANGSQAEAARRLGLSRSDLNYKLTKYGLKAVGAAD